MFSWIKNKLNERQSFEFDRGCERTLNFLNYAMSRSDASSADIIDMEVLENKIKTIKMRKKPNKVANDQDMDELLEVDGICRRIWTNVFKESHFSYDKRFNP